LKTFIQKLGNKMFSRNRGKRVTFIALFKKTLFNISLGDKMLFRYRGKKVTFMADFLRKHFLTLP